MMTKCAQCNRNFKSLGSHWSRSNRCNHPSINRKQHNIITGCLLGDGAIQKSDNRHPRLIVSNNSERFLNWLEDQLGWLSSSTGKAGGYADFQMWTMNHPELEQYWKWYSSGVKVFPDDVRLNAMTLKLWYVGDGTRYFQGAESSGCRIANTDQIKQLPKIVERMNEIGLPAKLHEGGLITFTNSADEKFLRFLGQSIPGYEYKWASNRPEYERLRGTRTGVSLLNWGDDISS